MVRNILVPLDGSTFAEHALPLALSLARRAGAALHLVTISTPLTQAYIEGVYVGPADLEMEVEGRYRGYLEEVKARLAERIGAPITLEVTCGDPALMLREMAESGKYDLIVMATHGRSPLGRFWLGSVADEVVRHVNLPVLLVRPTTEEPRLEAEPDLGRVVVSLDGTELSEQILEPAVALVGLIPAAEIVLVRAIRSIVADDVEPEAASIGGESRNLLAEVRRLQTEVEKEAEDYLARIAGRLQGRGLKVRMHVVAEDRPDRAILNEAEGEHAGMIALETHGRGGLARLFFGSVADRVIRGAHVPVLVHRPVKV